MQEECVKGASSDARKIMLDVAKCIIPQWWVLQLNSVPAGMNCGGTHIRLWVLCQMCVR